MNDELLTKLEALIAEWEAYQAPSWYTDEAKYGAECQATAQATELQEILDTYR